MVFSCETFLVEMNGNIPAFASGPEPTLTLKESYAVFSCETFVLEVIGNIWNQLLQPLYLIQNQASHWKTVSGTFLWSTCCEGEWKCLTSCLSLCIWSRTNSQIEKTITGIFLQLLITGLGFLNWIQPTLLEIFALLNNFHTNEVCGIRMSSWIAQFPNVRWVHV